MSAESRTELPGEVRDPHQTPPEPRPAVRELPAYVPGRQPTPRPGMATYKLSSNENPYSPLPGVLDAVARELAHLNRYPDMGAPRMYAALAEHLGVEPGELAAGTGSVAVLYHLLQAYCEAGDEVVYAWRSFEAYPIAVAVAGADSVQVPLDVEGRHDLEGMRRALCERTRVVILCSPNNPTGPALSQSQLVGFLKDVPARVLVVLDEAYREFVRSEDPLDPLALRTRFPNLVVVRTFAKAYGLAGMRVGYAVAHPVVAEAIRACALPFGVTDGAQVAVIASLAAEPDLLARVNAVIDERTRVTTALAAMGWHIPEAQGNFIWLDAVELSRVLDGAAEGEADDVALRFAHTAEEVGLMVRAFSDGVRVSIGEREANDRLVDLLDRLIDASPGR